MCRPPAPACRLAWLRSSTTCPTCSSNPGWTTEGCPPRGGRPAHRCRACVLTGVCQGRDAQCVARPPSAARQAAALVGGGSRPRTRRQRE
jgi:hypothetical protein